mmetsp:Transcript_131371/g.195689  ORF Transcript_131371/g.195689 Transcript_131371/m.195689 type:complete len:434 (+) Transcript_131371:135-1436(+)|eukprot:CAMPEP_0117031916 /NCGR_PEP_ID=MMETSP0472-20121206/22905_1 /TAXON_ID=693140 ORGANISM="Tiarina fusus, Strain LIS" /NCGR_SAMPLE_ID=MMETSP0472 /ASSEMBLY_ACC=CAM_ASM_000603 /LENGTH=433 /DNA_ID=CAMNT_0004740381 /DNA_START=129 /DNA_END=1430 /DNA_ORIENTATION=-
MADVEPVPVASSFPQAGEAPVNPANGETNPAAKKKKNRKKKKKNNQAASEAGERKPEATPIETRTENAENAPANVAPTDGATGGAVAKKKRRRRKKKATDGDKATDENGIKDENEENGVEGVVVENVTEMPEKKADGDEVPKKSRRQRQKEKKQARANAEKEDSAEAADTEREEPAEVANAQEVVENGSVDEMSVDGGLSVDTSGDLSADSVSKSKRRKLRRKRQKEKEQQGSTGSNEDTPEAVPTEVPSGLADAAGDTPTKDPVEASLPTTEDSTSKVPLQASKDEEKLQISEQVPKASDIVEVPKEESIADAKTKPIEPAPEANSKVKEEEAPAKPTPKQYPVHKEKSEVEAVSRSSVLPSKEVETKPTQIDTPAVSSASKETPGPAASKERSTVETPPSNSRSAQDALAAYKDDNDGSQEKCDCSACTIM